MTVTQNDHKGKMPPPQHDNDAIRDLVSVSPRRFLFLSLGIIGVLATMSAIAGFLFQTAADPRFRTEVFFRAFWLDNESNFPTFFNFSLIMLAAFLLISLSRLEFLSRSPMRYHWAIMAGIFFFFGFDEAAEFHEALVGPVRHILGVGGIFYFAWIIPAMVFIVIFFLAYLRFLIAQPFRVSARMILGGLLYVSGAVGMEMIGGTIAESGNMSSFAYALAAHIEEVLEMVGLSVFITALLMSLSNLTHSEEFLKTG